MQWKELNGPLSGSVHRRWVFCSYDVVTTDADEQSVQTEVIRPDFTITLHLFSSCYLWKSQVFKCQ